ncbi:MAG: hypothetical protein II773_07560, partial [Oscillospiraceae bacterium]|nr:hypothetical protein [Oscillospiraceae bacterium]
MLTISARAISEPQQIRLTVSLRHRAARSDRQERRSPILLLRRSDNYLCYITNKLLPFNQNSTNERTGKSLKTLSGIHISHDKRTENKETALFPLPEEVLIPMSQHMGAPCEPVVKKGDLVTVGQKIGDTDAFMSAPIHSSVSGEVTAIEDFLNTNGSVCKAVRIKPDGNQTVCPDITPPEITDRDSFIHAVRESGLTGLGGAGFPTHIKLNFDAVKTPIDTLIINAAECEPFITSDYR